MDFKTLETKLREGAAKGTALCGVRPSWLKDAADQAQYYGASAFESDFVALEELDRDSSLWYSNDLIDRDKEREATDYMLFDEPPMAGYSANGDELVVSIDPLER